MSYANATLYDVMITEKGFWDQAYLFALAQQNGYGFYGETGEWFTSVYDFGMIALPWADMEYARKQNPNIFIDVKRDPLPILNPVSPDTVKTIVSMYGGENENGYLTAPVFQSPEVVAFQQANDGGLITDVAIFDDVAPLKSSVDESANNVIQTMQNGAENVVTTMQDAINTAPTTDADKIKKAALYASMALLALRVLS